MQHLCEACVDSVESAMEAERGGASRLELCSNLFEGGTTPSFGLIKCTIQRVGIPVYVMIRPRGGDFLYTEEEFEVMKEDVKLCRRLASAPQTQKQHQQQHQQNSLVLQGVVFGILLPNGDVDVERTRTLVHLANSPIDNTNCGHNNNDDPVLHQLPPLKVTFHRAFDMTSHALRALEDVITVGGIERILTSGQESSCLEGADVLKQLVDAAAGRITIVAGGGLTSNNIRKVVQQTGVAEFHVSGRTSRTSNMSFKNTKCFMGGALRSDEFALSFTDSLKIHQLIHNSNSQ